VAVDEHTERDEVDEHEPGELEAEAADDEAEVEAHGGWGGAGRPEA
jgi:hypothetical protein